LSSHTAHLGLACGIYCPRMGDLQAAKPSPATQPRGQADQDVRSADAERLQGPPAALVAQLGVAARSGLLLGLQRACGNLAATELIASVRGVQAVCHCGGSCSECAARGESRAADAVEIQRGSVPPTVQRHATGDRADLTATQFAKFDENRSQLIQRVPLMSSG
jgi:hypothetical protein